MATAPRGDLRFIGTIGQAAGVMLGNELAGYLNIGFRAVDVLWAIAATAVGQVALPWWIASAGGAHDLALYSALTSLFAARKGA